jgi:hypothetical protein
MNKQDNEEKRSLTGGNDLLQLARRMARGNMDADEYFAAVEKRAEELVEREASALGLRALGES